MDLHSTSATQSPPDSPDLPTAIATRIPPELLLDIFSIISDSPDNDYWRYLRNQNLKSLALVHRAWKDSAQQILQEKIHIYAVEEEYASDEEIERIASVLVKSKVHGTKYLIVNGHLNKLAAKTGYAMWSQMRSLKLSTSSRHGGTTRMSDFTSFPRESLSLLHPETIWL